MNLEKVSSVLICLLVLMLAGASFTLHAACTLTSAAAVVNLPTVNLVPSDKGAVGTVLYSAQVPVPQIGYDCGSSVRSTWSSTYTRAEMSKSLISNVYSTGVAGIGIRIKWPESRADNAYVPGSYSCVGNCIESADKLTVEFVQTGVATSGTISSGSVAVVTVSPDNEPQNSLTILTVNLGVVNIEVRSCSIYANTNSVDLGDYSLADIQKIGFLGDKKDFTITLECPELTSAKITFEGREAWGMGIGIIENAGDAQNAYVKLYEKSGQRYSAKALNTLANFGASTSFTGTRTVTYAGEMYFDESSRANVTAGNVNSNIVYTLTIN